MEKGKSTYAEMAGAAGNSEKVISEKTELKKIEENRKKRKSNSKQNGQRISNGAERKVIIKMAFDQQQDIIKTLLASYDKISEQYRRLSHKNRDLLMALGEKKINSELFLDILDSQNSLGKKELEDLNKKYVSIKRLLRNVELAHTSEGLESSPVTEIDKFVGLVFNEDSIENSKNKELLDSSIYKMKLLQQRKFLVGIRKHFTVLKEEFSELEIELDDLKYENRLLNKEVKILKNNLEQEQDINNKSISETHNMRETINFQKISIDDLKLEVSYLKKSNNNFREKLNLLSTELNQLKLIEIKDTSINKILKKILQGGYTTLTLPELNELYNSVRNASKQMVEKSWTNLLSKEQTNNKTETNNTNARQKQKIGLSLPPNVSLLFNNLSRRQIQTQKRSQVFRENVLHCQRELLNIRCWIQELEEYRKSDLSQVVRKQQEVLIGQVRLTENNLMHLLETAEAIMKRSEELEKEIFCSMETIKQLQK